MQYEDEEIWKPVEGTDGYYSVSNHGRVRSEARTLVMSNQVLRVVPQKIMKPAINFAGYCIVTICTDVQKKIRVHRLVAEAFIPNPKELDVVNHLDACKTNNHWSNLEWTDAYGNVKHATEMGLLKPTYGEASTSSIYTLDQILNIRRLSAQGFKNKQIEEVVGISCKYISRVLRKECWNFPEAFP